MPVQRISHYEIETTLGEGAMGRVYRARDVVLDRPVALKVLAGVSLSDPSFLDRFRREARLAAQLNHPHIARIYEFGEDGGSPFLVMELVEGTTLADMIRHGPLPVETVRRFGRQIASALGAAHAKGIVHRDIKPGNVMVTPEGNVQVMDFGIARRQGEAQLTTDGSLMGTPNTMAPETINGQEPGPPADLFAMGCVLYEALAGTPPFKGADPLTVLFQVVHGDPPHLGEVRPDVPSDLAALIEGLLVKDPDARLGPARAVEEALAGPPATGRHTPWAPPATGTIAVTPALAGAAGESRATGALPGTARATGALRDVSGSTGAAAIGAAASGEATSGAASPGEASPRRRRGRAIALAAVLVIVAGAGGYALMQSGVGRSPAERHAQAVRLNDALGAVLADKVYRQGAAAAPESLAQARRYFERAARLDPAFPNPWHNLGNLSLYRGEFGAAEREFRKALEIDPRYAIARVGLADALERQQKHADAEAQYLRVIDDDSTLVYAPNNLAYLLITTGRPAEAIRILMPALKRWPDVAVLWKNYGLACLKLGSLGQAEPAFTRALELDPANAAAMAGLAQVAEARGNRAAAVAIWQKLTTVADTAVAHEAQRKLKGS